VNGTDGSIKNMTSDIKVILIVREVKQPGLALPSYLFPTSQWKTHTPRFFNPYLKIPYPQSSPFSPHLLRLGHGKAAGGCKKGELYKFMLK
jgi:hypothetical protein